MVLGFTGLGALFDNRYTIQSILKVKFALEPGKLLWFKVTAKNIRLRDLLSQFKSRVPQIMRYSSHFEGLVFWDSLSQTWDCLLGVDEFFESHQFFTPGLALPRYFGIKRCWKQVLIPRDICHCHNIAN